MVGDQIGDGEVDLVTDARHHRHDRRRDMARATTSSLNAHRSSSEPPPRPDQQHVDTAQPVRDRRCRAAMSRAAPAPWTRTGRTTTRAAGQRRRSVVSMSCTAAPVQRRDDADVRGNRGSGRLRSAAKSPSAASRVLQLLEGEAQRARDLAAPCARRRAGACRVACRARADRARRRRGPPRDRTAASAPHARTSRPTSWLLRDPSA